MIGRHEAERQDQRITELEHERDVALRLLELRDAELREMAERYREQCRKTRELERLVGRVQSAMVAL